MSRFALAARRLVVLGVVAAATAVLFAGVGQAATSHMLGVVRPNVAPHANTIVLPLKFDNSAAPTSPASNTCTPLLPPGGCAPLDYNGGPVMTSNTTYALYWAPSGYSFPAGYQSVINQYFADVAHDSGMNTNIYSTDTQFADPGGNIVSTNSTFGGAAVDTNPYPVLDPVNCNNPATTTGFSGQTYTACITDAQLSQEVTNAIAANHWQSGLSSEIFVFLPQHVDTCAGLDSNNNPICADNTFCAYHGWTGDQTSPDNIYANMPFGDFAGCENTPVHQSQGGQYPNGNPADAELSITSHEHNEALTDPTGLGWWSNLTGFEDGDNCAYFFGNPQGGSFAAHDLYNQTINGHHYMLQEEWSNDGSTCLQSYQTQSQPAPWASQLNLPFHLHTGQTFSDNGLFLQNVKSVLVGNYKVKKYAISPAGDAISFTVPANMPSGPLTVTTKGGTFTTGDLFFVAPTYSGLSSSALKPGQTLRIYGTGLAGLVDITFDGNPTMTFWNNKGNMIKVKVPASANFGPISVGMDPPWDGVFSFLDFSTDNFQVK